MEVVERRQPVFPGDAGAPQRRQAEPAIGQHRDAESAQKPERPVTPGDRGRRASGRRRTLGESHPEPMEGDEGRDAEIAEDQWPLIHPAPVDDFVLRCDRTRGRQRQVAVAPDGTEEPHRIEQRAAAFAAPPRPPMDERKRRRRRQKAGDQKATSRLQDGDLHDHQSRRDEADQTLQRRHGRAVARSRLPAPKWFMFVSTACSALAVPRPNTAANGARPSAVLIETSR